MVAVLYNNDEKCIVSPWRRFCDRLFRFSFSLLKCYHDKRNDEMIIQCGTQGSPINLNNSIFWKKNIVKILKDSDCEKQL